MACNLTQNYSFSGCKLPNKNSLKREVLFEKAPCFHIKKNSDNIGGIVTVYIIDANYEYPDFFPDNQ